MKFWEEKMQKTDAQQSGLPSAEPEAYEKDTAGRAELAAIIAEGNNERVDEKLQKQQDQKKTKLVYGKLKIYQIKKQNYYRARKQDKHQLTTLWAFLFHHSLVTLQGVA